MIPNRVVHTNSKRQEFGKIEINAPKSKYIKIEKTSVIKRRVILSQITCSKELAKYFQTSDFWVWYDVDIQNVPLSILQIPILSTIISVAWAVGADVYVEELDTSYLKSLNEIKRVFKVWYPNLSYSTVIHVQKKITNRFSNRIYGLLFSGGVDSTISYLRYKFHKPHLIMIWGGDIPLIEEEFWKKVKNNYKEFAQKENSKINFIATNLREFLNEGQLNITFSRYLENSSWWARMQDGISLLSLSAPISVAKNIGTLLIASTVSQKLNYRVSSHPRIINKLSWADLKVIYDNFDFTKLEKIRNILKPFIITNKCNLTLRVCFSQFRAFNCNKCEKCQRTITDLVLENIDPNKLGFAITHNFFDSLKRQLIIAKEKYVHLEYLGWYDIQSNIPEFITHNLYNSKSFFIWLKNFDLSKKQKKSRINIRWHLSWVYYKSPMIIRPILTRLEPIFTILSSKLSKIDKIFL